jgi:hypothetical protein
VRARLLQPLQQHDDIDERASLTAVRNKIKIVSPAKAGTHFHAGGSIAGAASTRGPFNACRRWVSAFATRKRG